MGFLVFTSVGHFVFSPLLEKENSKTLQLNSCGAIFLAISSRWSISSSSAVAWNDETWPLVTIVFAARHKCSEHHWSTFNMLAYNLAWHTHIFAQIQYKLRRYLDEFSAIPWFQSTPDPHLCHLRQSLRRRWPQGDEASQLVSTFKVHHLRIKKICPPVGSEDLP